MQAFIGRPARDHKMFNKNPGSYFRFIKNPGSFFVHYESRFISSVHKESRFICPVHLTTFIIRGHPNATQYHNTKKIERGAGGFTERFLLFMWVSLAPMCSHCVLNESIENPE